VNWLGVVGDVLIFFWPVHKRIVLLGAALPNLRSIFFLNPFWALGPPTGKPHKWMLPGGLGCGIETFDFPVKLQLRNGVHLAYVLSNLGELSFAGFISLDRLVLSASTRYSSVDSGLEPQVTDTMLIAMR
jgi:hypothetical protein